MRVTPNRNLNSYSASLGRGENKKCWWRQEQSIAPFLGYPDATETLQKRNVHTLPSGTGSFDRRLEESKESQREAGIGTEWVETQRAYWVSRDLFSYVFWRKQMRKAFCPLLTHLSQQGEVLISPALFKEHTLTSLSQKHVLQHLGREWRPAEAWPSWVLRHAPDFCVRGTLLLSHY